MLEARTHAEGKAAESRHEGAAVAVEHVSKSYDSRIVAVRDVSLAIEPGEFVSLTGPSGCGKSTLLNLIGSLARPDAGDILVDGVSVPGLNSPAEYRRTTVGFVFQLHHLLPTISAGGNVEVPLIGAGLGRRERRERARELLAEVGLAERVDHLPSQLSGGERQRVAVARALANRPRLLLADEPTGALDSKSSLRVLELLASLRERYGMTMLVVSYDPEVGRHADRTLSMEDGRILSSGA
ncbi:MAG TPA: ABC transporter ATP-binding protein [Thermoleophilaceae bacterium]|jgi:putative ABC transport system ATP-binding protein|nr:ABC transporter ATP-binding protein [Thermoleophilaceae bacterium]